VGAAREALVVAGRGVADLEVGAPHGVLRS
jgi:hypothetical protein